MRVQDSSELDAFVRDVWTGEVFLNLGRELYRVTFAQNLPDRVLTPYSGDVMRLGVDNGLSSHLI
jgi:hypothetical protein